MYVDNQFVNGRGTIAYVEYTGDDAAAEIKKLLSAVVANEDDFEAWEALAVRVSELEGGVNRNSSPSAIELVRNVYDCFLAKFPLFFGYWKKYADLEFQIGGTETAELAYERGVSCIPCSVDLWSQYCEFKMRTCHDADLIRELFERGAEFVGMDFQSALFWDKYIEFEERFGTPAHIVKIHERLTHIPLQQYTRYYEKFRLFIQNRPVEELTDADKLETFKTQVDLEVQRGPARSDLELDRLLRAAIDAHYVEIYQAVLNEVTKRWTFEGSIKRSYFHVTDVDEAELDNWRKYLEFEETQGDFKRISFLYERCMVVCALYEEFWLRYVRWMFAQGKDEDTRIIYMKASCIFVPIAQPMIRLHWARFEEKLGRIQEARDIHLAILLQLPGHVETIISAAGLERRHEGNDAAIDFLQYYVNKEEASVAGQLTAEQARILWQCSGAVDKARQLFKDRYETYPESQEFWLSYLKFEIGQPAPSEEEARQRIKAVHELMRTKSNFTRSTLKELSRPYMEYLLNCGSTKAAEEYLILDKELNGASTLDSIIKEQTADAARAAEVTRARAAQAAQASQSGEDTVMQDHNNGDVAA